MTSRIIILAVGISLILSSMFTLRAVGHPNKHSKDISSGWLFTEGGGDRMANPSLDDMEWKVVDFSKISTQNAITNKTVWFRKHVDVRGMKTDHLYLHINTRWQTEKVFVNGTEVGNTFENGSETIVSDEGAYVFRIDEAYLDKEGDNLIAIKAKGTASEVTLAEEEIGLYNHGNFSENTVHLEGKWKFHTSDRLAWMKKGYNDRLWTIVNIPFKATTYNFDDYYGIAWYRKVFELNPADQVTGMVIALGKIGEKNEVFLNGVKLERIDSNCDSKDVNWKNVQIFNIPDHVLTTDTKNVVTVRVYDEAYKDGLYKGALAIFPDKEQSAFKENYSSFSHKNK